jgi:hypothetical protein
MQRTQVHVEAPRSGNAARKVSATLENEADATLENEATGSSVSSLPCLGF